MIQSSTPKIILKCRFRFALNNPDNKFKNSSYKNFLESDIKRMTGYYKDKDKEIIGMIDYYTGRRTRKN